MKLNYLYVALFLVAFLLAFCEAGRCSTNDDDYCDNKCGNCQGYCGCCKCGNCGSSNCGACPTCEKTPNPPFTKQCAVKMVLILDESGSIDEYINEVVAGARSFWTALGAINNIGGTASMGLIEFNGGARIVKDRMFKVTQSYIKELDDYIQNNAENQGTNGYYPEGCTNWGQALSLVRTTNWPDESTGSTTDRPDIVIFFTDGVPTLFNGQCEHQCSAGASFAAAGFRDADDIAVACYEADRLKKTGVKIFLVGVGGVAGNDFKMEGVTGPIKWDQTVANFATADYIPDPNYDRLGAILYNVAVGLCPCLQQQPLCQDANNGGSCLSKFTARVRVASVGGSVSYPAYGESVAFIYYDFSSAVDQRVAYQFFDPSPDANGQVVLPPKAGSATAAVLREDIHNPCEVTRRVECGATGTPQCYLLADKQYVPRFFHERTDKTPTGTFPSASTLFDNNCNSIYEKVYEDGLQLPERVRYLYGSNVNGVFIPCGAVTYDSTIFYFLDGTVGSTYGVTPNVLTERPTNRNTNPTGDFDFNKNAGNCPAPLCRSPVEVVFVIDEQKGVEPSTFTDIKNYVAGLVDSFDTQGGIRFAVVWTNNLNPIGGGTNGAFKFDNNHVSFINSVQGHSKKNTDPNESDFAAAITYGINKAWPSSATASSAPRHMVVIMAGPQKENSPSWSAVRNLRDSRGVEIWGVGVEAGADYISTLNEFTTQTPYVHSATFTQSSLLDFDIQPLGSRLCPGDASLCDGCNGFCACPGNCICPTCTATTCGPRSCLSPQTGCVGDSYVCDDKSRCTTDVCTPTLVNPTCDYTSITCNDNDPCTLDTCDSAAGCVYTPKNCNDNDVCTSDSCNAVTGKCQFTDIASCPDACKGNPCNFDNSNNCTEKYCIYQQTPATPLPAGAISCEHQLVQDKGEVAACKAAVAANNRYCFTSLVRTCPSTTCYEQVCDIASGTCQPGQARCVAPDACQLATCDQATGCAYVQRDCPRLDQCIERKCEVNASTTVGFQCVPDQARQVQCNDNDPCTIDVCEPATGCKYTPKICNVSSNCAIASCNETSGVCEEVIIATLLDFCGVCNGDNVACFFQNTDDLKQIGGLAGGIVAAIVIAAVIALLLALWLGKRGYDSYMAKNAMASSSAKSNPTFKANENTATVPDGLFQRG